MEEKRIKEYLDKVLNNMPDGWLSTTTHRLDIYNESLAKVEFLDKLEVLYHENKVDLKQLDALPTAYDYIRLGHPLSCLLEWGIAKINNTNPACVISFSSKVTPLLAILRKNHLDGGKTRINYIGDMPNSFDSEIIKRVYGYSFELNKVPSIEDVKSFSGSNILISSYNTNGQISLNDNIDFYIGLHSHYGSILLVNGESNESYISEIQHVRRRETIAMTPINCEATLLQLLGKSTEERKPKQVKSNKEEVINTIHKVTKSLTKAVVGSSGLSIQYAIMMGLIDEAKESYPNKDIKFVVPPNCYGGTNDQARRVAACIDNVEIVDLPVDGGNDMVQGIHTVLDTIAAQDAIAYIIAEIPTNPRVEVPDLIKLQEALSQERKTPSGDIAVAPVFILDQTFCPNVHFLGEGAILSSVKTISYASGSKFPSGGKCTAGYAIGNTHTKSLMDKIELHLELCDNEATDLQYEILAEQMPSMIGRIADAYKNTRSFVSFIEEVLPTAKINFVSEELASQGFTPSVFSLDLPTKGDTAEERELYKRAQNLKLINLMITNIPDESKYCVSYGQLKGCYWTIPATSTQGTTREGDKDYIARVSLSGDMNLEKHKEVFREFVEGM